MWKVLRHELDRHAKAVTAAKDTRGEQEKEVLQAAMSVPFG